MNTFYENLLKATNNLTDITFSKYATVNSINEDTASVTLTDNELSLQNVPIINPNFCVDDTVIVTFIQNSLHNPVIIGGLNNPYNYEQTLTNTNYTLYKNINTFYLVLKGTYNVTTEWSTITTLNTDYSPNTTLYFTINEDTIAKITTTGLIQIKSQNNETITLTGGITYPNKEYIQ